MLAAAAERYLHARLVELQSQRLDEGDAHLVRVRVRLRDRVRVRVRVS